MKHEANGMSSEPKPTLEQAVDRELRRLSVRRAPESLIPSVLALIESRAKRPWYRREWRHWPSGLRWLSFGLAVLSLVGLVWGESHLAQAGWAKVQALPIGKAGLMVLTLVEALMEAVGVVLSRPDSRFLGVMAAVAGSSVVLCLGGGTLWMRYLKVGEAR